MLVQIEGDGGNRSKSGVGMIVSGEHTRLACWLRGLGAHFSASQKFAMGGAIASARGRVRSPEISDQ